MEYRTVELPDSGIIEVGVNRWRWKMTTLVTLPEGIAEHTYVWFHDVTNRGSSMRKRVRGDAASFDSAHLARLAQNPDERIIIDPAGRRVAIWPTPSSTESVLIHGEGMGPRIVRLPDDTPLGSASDDEILELWKNSTSHD